eukprot:40656_1
MSHRIPNHQKEINEMLSKLPHEIRQDNAYKRFKEWNDMVPGLQLQLIKLKGNAQSSLIQIKHCNKLKKQCDKVHTKITINNIKKWLYQTCQIIPQYTQQDFQNAMNSVKKKSKKVKKQTRRKKRRRPHNESNPIGSLDVLSNDTATDNTYEHSIETKSNVESDPKCENTISHECNDKCKKEWSCPDCGQIFVCDQFDFLRHVNNCPGFNDFQDQIHIGASEIIIGSPQQHNKSCGYCNGPFTDSNRWYLCQFCKIYCNAGHLKEMIACGEYEFFPLCRMCCQDEVFQFPPDVLYLYVHCKSTKLVCQDLHPQTGVMLDTYSVCTNKSNIMLYTKDDIIPQRFITIENAKAKEILGEELHTQLLNNYEARNKLMKFKDYTFDLYTNIVEYADKYHNPEWLAALESILKFPRERIPCHISDLGTCKKNGFVVIDGLGTMIVGFDVIFRSVIAVLIHVFPDIVDPEKNQLKDNEFLRKFCPDLLADKTSRGIFLSKAYKGGKTCFRMQNDEGVDLSKTSVDDRYLQYDYSSRSSRKNDIKVIKSKLYEYFKNDEKFKQFFVHLNVIKLVICLVQYALGNEFPALKNMFHQFIELGILDGGWLNIIDLLAYLCRHLVPSHADDKALTLQRWKHRQEPLHIGPYAVWKGPNKETQTLCLVGNRNQFCGFNPNEWEHGHCDLIAYTLYFMTNVAVYGGPTHMIHRKVTELVYDAATYNNQACVEMKELSWQLVMRPCDEPYSDSDSDDENSFSETDDDDTDFEWMRSGKGLEIFTPTINPFFETLKGKIKKIKCGLFHSIIITTKGECYIFGNKVYNEEDNVPYKLIMKKYYNAIIDISCTSKHDLILLYS